MNAREVSVREAFGRHAGGYDRRFTNTPLGKTMRAEVWRIADRAFSDCRHILDLGCGTGEDTLYMAKRGIHVTALDLAPQMVAALRAKAAEAHLSSNIDCLTSEMTRVAFAGQHFDGIFSNFGALNCVPDLRWLRALAESTLKAQSRLVLTTMGRFYPLESAVFLMKGRPDLAFRRLRRPCKVTIEGISINVYYHSLRSIRRMLGSNFELESVVGLRALMPVPGWEHLERVPLSGCLERLDRALCRWRATAVFADHFVSVWQYRP